MSGNEIPVEAREQVCAPRPFHSGIGACAVPASRPKRAHTRPNPEIAGQERGLEGEPRTGMQAAPGCVQQATPYRSGVGRIAVVEHEVVAVWVREERHVADTGVKGVAGELDALGLELGAGGGDVFAP